MRVLLHSNRWDVPARSRWFKLLLGETYVMIRYYSKARRLVGWEGGPVSGRGRGPHTWKRERKIQRERDSSFHPMDNPGEAVGLVVLVWVYVFM